MWFKEYVICVLGFLVMPALSLGDSRHFEVQEWCFCRSIDINNKMPLDPLSDPAEATGKERLFLWMRISVNENGIRYLRGYKKLPIYNIWGRNGWIEGSEINIGITTQNWNNGNRDIENEIKLRNGSFDWRTFSEKVEYVYDGEHYVSVLDAERRAVVLCKDRYNAFRPTINVRVKRN